MTKEPKIINKLLDEENLIGIVQYLIQNTKYPIHKTFNPTSPFRGYVKFYYGIIGDYNKVDKFIKTKTYKNTRYDLEVDGFIFNEIEKCVSDYLYYVILTCDIRHAGIKYSHMKASDRWRHVAGLSRINRKEFIPREESEYEKQRRDDWDRYNQDLRDEAERLDEHNSLLGRK